MNRINKNTTARAGGFTLIETIAVIAITSLVFAAVSWAIISFYRANGYIIHQAYAVDSARKGIEVMTREIREAAYSDTGAYPIVSADSSEFIFYSDIDRDSSIERVRYFLDGSDFKRGVIKASGDPLIYDPANETISVLSEYVRNTQSQPVFTFYDSSGNEVAGSGNVADITLVGTRLVVNAVEGRAPEEFTLRSTAQIRNLKTNL